MEGGGIDGGEGGSQNTRLLHDLCLLADEVVEGGDLFFNPKTKLISFKKVRVRFFKFLPHQLCKGRFDVGLQLERGDHFDLVHVQVEASSDEVLDECHLLDCDYFTCCPGRLWKDWLCGSFVGRVVVTCVTIYC